MPSPSSPRSWRRADRVSAILDHLDAAGSISVPELAAMFGVSLATVRRDLQLLEEQKLLERTHGGAVAVEAAHELPLRYRAAQTAQKRDIARVAVSRVPMGAVVGLTGGSTTTEVARQLAVRESLSVVTNALNIAAELALRPKVKVVVPGGVARPQSYELVGLWSEQALRVLNVGVAIVGVDGVDPDGGLTTHDEVEAQTNAALLSRARRVIVVADGSKLGRVHLARIAGIDDVDEIITDAQADPAEVQRLRSAGATVTLAPPSAARRLAAVPEPDDIEEPT
ncbi:MULTISPECIES: DeoR/GlpR family DNA-binding transcription regulator [unclassified Nocardioides]|uniref:DeoR/GlpR family DNA-binding transcription regulator n=1 Tax=unclassified Nocardioides TaxID=2615069 RepID=UPI003618E4CC